MAEETGGERSLPASPLKKQRARQEGNIAKSQDLSAAVALAVALIAMVLLGPGIYDTMTQSSAFFLSNASEMVSDRMPPATLALRAFYFVAVAVLPFMAVMMIAGITGSLFQVGFLITGKPVQPQLNRINPISGFARYASLRTLVELVKSLFKVGLIAAVTVPYLFGETETLITLMSGSLEMMSSQTAALVIGLWWRVTVVMLILGLIDYAYQRWQYEQDLRMSVQEARQEAKELEGDPQIKRRVRQLQRQMAAQRMMAAVPEAEVVVTNPTHYAVALRYDEGRMAAPAVVAKGERLLAERIRAIADEHGVPIVQRPDLARQLFRTLDVGDAIPEALFRAVAEVLSYVYQIDRRVEKKRARSRVAV